MKPAGIRCQVSLLKRGEGNVGAYIRIIISVRLNLPDTQAA
jgi:hypothetical protein